MMNKLSEGAQKRSVFLGQRLGSMKPYHWTLVDGKLTIAPGFTEHEEIRAKIVQRLIEKGVPKDKISYEMIESVVANAESRALHAELEDTDVPPNP